MDLLTNSRSASFKACRKQCYIAYELGIRKIDDARALRMGSAHHDAIEALGLGHGIEVACGKIRDRYDYRPEHIDALEWAYEQETLLRLACAYQWRWQNDGLTYVETEHQFALPLIGPRGESKDWLHAGKIDGIVQLDDGRLAVKESKLLGDDISSESDLWPRLRMDHQITGYVAAARRLGFKVDCVLYDVTRKPVIKPEQVPLLDELGAKIVLDMNMSPPMRVKTAQNKWRQTGDKELNYVLQSRPMTPEEWGEKLTNDIASRPDFYFQRKEIARLDCDLDEYQSESWDTHIAIKDARRFGRWYRTVGQHCKFCAYFGPCSSGIDLEKELPEGLVRLQNIHPELQETEHVNGSPALEAESAPSF